MLSRYLPPFLGFTLAFGLTYALAHRQTSDGSLNRGNVNFEIAAATDNKPDSVGARKYHDALLAQALDGRDLVLAVREILRHNEDGGASVRLALLVENLPKDRFGKIPEILAILPRDGYDFSPKGDVMRAWAKRDPQAAVAWAEKNSNLRDALRGWAQAAPAEALAWLEQPHSAASIHDFRLAVFSAMGESDPQQAFNGVRQRGWLNTEPTLVQDLIYQWASRDPAAASGAFRSVLQGYGLEDVLLAGDRGSSWETTQPYRSLLDSLLAGARSQSDTAAKEIFDSLPGLLKREGKVALAQQVSLRNPDEFAALLKDPNVDVLRYELVNTNATALLNNFAELPDDSWRMEVLNSYRCALWIMDSNVHDQVLDYLGHLDTAKRDETTANVIMRIGCNAPALSKRCFDLLSASQQEQLGPVMMRDIARVFPDAGLAQFRELPEAVQVNSLRGLCAGMAITSPESALSLALQQDDAALRSRCAAAVFVGNESEGNDAGGSGVCRAVKLLEAHASELDLPRVLACMDGAANFTINIGTGITTKGRGNAAQVTQRLQELIAEQANSPNTTNAP